MAQKKASSQTSPWFAVTLGVLGLVAGYGLVLQQSGQLSAHAGNLQCPLKHDCTSGACTPDCPLNCNHTN